MKLIGEVGGVDLAVLPIGDNFTMGPDDAVTAAQFVKAKHVLPSHYNTFPVIEVDARGLCQETAARDRHRLYGARRRRKPGSVRSACQILASMASIPKLNCSSPPI